MEHPELVTMGESMVRFSPPDGERIETATSLDFRTAGAESNVAVTAARLGVKTAWLSKLPDSPLGRKVTSSLRKHGVTPLVEWSDDGRLGTYYIEFGTEPRGTNVIYDRTDAAVTTTTPEDLSLSTIHDATIFFTSGITPALSDTLESTVTSVFKTAASHDTTTAFDLNYRSKLWSRQAARESFERLLPRVDVLIAAERDARNVLELKGNVETIAESLRETYDHEIVVITQGDQGALALTDNDVFEQPAFESGTVDPVGTGDAFVGGFLTHYIRDNPVPDALEYGVATAAFKRTIRGDVAVVTREEIEAVLEQKHEGIQR